MTIMVHSLVGAYAVAAEDGKRLHEEIHRIMKAEGGRINVYFDEVKVIATPFLNTAVGGLLEVMTPEELSDRINFSHLPKVGETVLRKVIENAKRFYHDPARREALDRVLWEQPDED
jgi:hypothetical protein